MIDAGNELKRGLLWFGSATLLTRLLDLGATLVVLRMLTQQDMGLAALVVSMVMMFEAFNGLGVGPALVQAKDVSRSELDSLFWFCAGVGCIAAALLLLAAPFVAGFYREPQLQPMLMAASSKLVFVGVAQIPLQLLSRDLRFRAASTAQGVAAALEAVTKIGLALAGAGAWALVIANAARGAYALVVAYVLAPHWPKLRFQLAEVRRFLSFGLRNALSTAIFYVYRNADSLLIGRFLGVEALGLYRVAFEIAMAPLDVVIQVVNRVAFPLYARLARESRALADAFGRSCRYVFVLIGPIVVVLCFSAEDVVRIVAHERWLGATTAVQVLCWAALLRGLAQLFPELFYAVGRPEYAVYGALLSMVTLVAGFVGALALGGEQYGMLAVCAVWVLAHPVVIGVLMRWSSKTAGIPPREVVSTLLPIAGGLLAMSAPLGLVAVLPIELGSFGNLALNAFVGLAVYMTYLHGVLKLRLHQLKPSAVSADPGT